MTSKLKAALDAANRRIEAVQNIIFDAAVGVLAGRKRGDDK